jgi:hypothetical protein
VQTARQAPPVKSTWTLLPSSKLPKFKKFCKKRAQTAKRQYNTYIQQHSKELKMTAVWNTFVDGMQGKFAKPVELAGVTAQRYDMGKAVGKVRKVAAVAEVVAAVKPRATKEGGRVTLADRVREQIRAAKDAGNDAATVVQWAQEVLGMARAQAQVYVKNNWQKV